MGGAREPAAALTINGSRLLDTIHSTCEFGKAHVYGEHPTETGMARLALGDDDRKVRLWFVEQVKALGCVVTVDQMGNIFAVRPGRAKHAPPIMMGSHLDTQPTGGRYDGILGVMAGLEALRTIHENGHETRGPVGVINWTNEEGARFPMVTMSSSVWAGSTPLETAWNCLEISPPGGSAPRSVKQELARIGFLGDIPASYTAQPIAAHFELHIEQGPILEDESQKIGVVTGAQAYNWYQVQVKGRDSHAGTTPMRARKDAMLAAAKMVVASNVVAHEMDGLITTGIFRGEPGSVNTMAHTVTFTLDIRHPRSSSVASMVAKCRQRFEEIATQDSERGVSVSWETLTENPAVEFHRDCINAVEQAAEETCGRLTEAASGRKLWRHMLSGAGHDSCHTSLRCPTAMIFTPTRNGMSHTPDEYCSPEDCITGAQVLLGAVLRYDAARDDLS
ncbi:putative hydantoin utilization protein C [Stachybotrys elegans]|uniref:Hydantoin utilization protein C n=1 Tax=Stachybotrys elegans TaxID=80388 RepID=A0A8K0SZD4_9HYPO|nr:putative hydantoin utilization protein C [Stachybotrys elegans]